MTISLEMVLPGLAGYWLDQKLGTWVLFMLIGFTLGVFAAVVHLIQLTRRLGESGATKHTQKSSSDNLEKKEKS